MDVLCPGMLALLAGIILIPLVQLLLRLLVGSRRERPWEWRDALSRGLDSWKSPLVGLFIAIPAIAAYNILRNRVQRLVLEVGIISEGLMSRFSSVGSGGSTGAGAKKR